MYFVQMLKHFLLAIFITLSAVIVQAEDPTTTQKTVVQNQTTLAIPLGVSIKILPAFYWGVLGAQVEYPISKKLTANIMIMSKLSESRSYAVKKEDFHENGFSVDLFGKYYFKENAPEGLYALADLSFNTMIFYDGTTRPYAMHNRWKDFNGYRVPNDIKKPNPFNFAAGVGYQMIIIPQHIIADVFMGASANLDHDNSFFVQFYIAPSLGYVF